MIMNETDSKVQMVNRRRPTRGMTVTWPEFQKMFPLYAETHALAHCVCGHFPAAHREAGCGDCEGLLTGLDDGIAGLHACSCQRYREEVPA